MLKLFDSALHVWTDVSTQDGLDMENGLSCLFLVYLFCNLLLQLLLHRFGGLLLFGSPLLYRIVSKLVSCIRFGFEFLDEVVLAKASVVLRC